MCRREHIYAETASLGQDLFLLAVPWLHIVKSQLG